MFRGPVFEKIKLPALTAILAFMFVSFSYAAVELPDDTRTGSINVTLIAGETKEAVRGGEITLYKAGEAVHDDDWNYSFRLTDEFRESGCSLDDPDKRNAQLAGELAEYADKNSINGIACSAIDNEGKAVFSGLDIGLYLLVQTEASEGYYSVNPFMVSVPLYNETEKTYQYTDIDTFPKTEPAQKEVPDETEPRPEETETSGTSPNSGSGGGSGSGSRTKGSSLGGPGVSEDGADEVSDIWFLLPLPQTGQDRAMLPAAMILSISAIAIIALLRLRRRT